MSKKDVKELLMDALQAVVEIHAEASVKVGAVIEELKCSVLSKHARPAMTNEIEGESMSDSHKAKDALIAELIETLEQAHAHLEYCGYGDSWERECAEGLDDKIVATLNKARKASND